MESLNRTIWTTQVVELGKLLFTASISYAKVDAKMDGIITEFSARVTQLRETQGKLVESPAHARMILHGTFNIYSTTLWGKNACSIHPWAQRPDKQLS